MKFEMDSSTERVCEKAFAWTALIAIVLSVLLLAGYCVYGYRHEREIAIQAGFTPNHTESQYTRTLVNEYERQLLLPLPGNEWNTFTK